MGIGGPEQEVDGQAGAATEQGMHPIAAQKRKRMVSRSVAHRGIGILSAPSQDGSTIDDQIAGPDQATAHGAPYCEHEKGFKGWGSSCLPALTQLRGTGNAWDSISSLRQTTGQRQGRPTYQPVMHVLVGEPPQRFQYGDHEPRLFAVGARRTAWSFRQRPWTAPMGQLNGQAAQGKPGARSRSS